MSLTAPHTGHVARLLALIGAAALVTILAPTTASAGETRNLTPPVAPTVPVMIVLDASGSMNADDAPGPRITAAKAAVNGLIDLLPAGAVVGLQVYGTGTGSSDAEKTAGCTDIKTLAPVGPLDAASLKSAVDAVQASGYTPIGNALRAAAEELPNEGPRSIVLVSDGEDTCAPPAPCDVAKELKQQGIDLTVHTIGFKVDAAARAQLQCIAETTGGTYGDANDANQLNQALQIKVDYAITGYNPQGTPVIGAGTPTFNAPQLAPGQYLDTYALGGAAMTIELGTAKYYTIPAPEGFTPYVSVTMVAPTDTKPGGQSFLGSDIAIINVRGEECGGETKGYEILHDDTITSPTTVLAGDPIHVLLRDNCVQDGRMLVRVARLGSAFPGVTLTAEIAVRLEPPVDPSTTSSPAAGSPPPAPPAHGSPTLLPGSSSFNDATEIAADQTYAGSIVTGESRFYKIPLTWGQQFAYTLTETGSTNPSSFPVVVSADWFNPVRSSAPIALDKYASWFGSDFNNPLSASADYPLRYLNRDSTEASFYSLDGFFYLRISATDPASMDSQSADFLLTVAVGGAVEPGPKYQIATTPSATVPGSDSSSAAVGTSAEASATDRPDSNSSTTAATPIASSITVAANSDTVTGNPTSIVVVATLVLALLIGVAGWVVLRRRRPPTNSPR